VSHDLDPLIALFNATPCEPLQANVLMRKVAMFPVAQLRWACGRIGLPYPPHKASAVESVTDALMMRYQAAQQAMLAQPVRFDGWLEPRPEPAVSPSVSFPFDLDVAPAPTPCPPLPPSEELAADVGAGLFALGIPGARPPAPGYRPRAGTIQASRRERLLGMTPLGRATLSDDPSTPPSQ
jgi:hypothetical protein